jgi:hypothetical protein
MNRKLTNASFLLIFVLFIASGIKSQSYFCPVTNPYSSSGNGSAQSQSCVYSPVANGIYTIPVLFHCFTSTECPQGLRQLALNEAILRTGIDKLGQPFDAIINLKMALYDIDGACIDNGAKSYPPASVGSSIASLNGFINSNFPNGQFNTYDERYLNVFVVENITTQGVVGYATLPTSNYRAIVIEKAVLESPWNNDKGVFAHELGHFLNLFHTHSDAVVGACNNVDRCAGDLVESTNQGPFYEDLEPFYGSCSKLNLCNDTNHLFDMSNLMTYGCNAYLEEDQHDRMMQSLVNDHANLLTLSNYELTLGTSEVISGLRTFYPGNYLGKSYFVEDSSTIEIVGGNVNMSGCVFRMSDKCKVVVKSGATLILDNISVMNSECTKEIWEGIIVESGGKIRINNDCNIAGAKIGIHAKIGSGIDVRNSFFNDNEISIRLGEEGQAGGVRNLIEDNEFDGKKYLNRTGDPFTFDGTFFAIQAFEVGATLIVDNEFNRINTAISSINNINRITHNEILSNVALGIIIKNKDRKNTTLSNNTVYASLTAIEINNVFLKCDNNIALGKRAMVLRGAQPIPGLETLSFYGNELSVTQQVAPQVTEKALIASSLFRMHMVDNTIEGVSISSSGYLDVYSTGANFGTINIWDISVDLLKVSFSNFYSSNFLYNLKLQSGVKNLFYENYIANSSVEYASQNTFGCNDIDNTSKFKGNCLGTKLIENNFDEQFTLESGPTTISPQNDNANLFESATATYSSNLDVGQNRFTVKNTPDQIPNQINGPNDWFVPTGNRNYDGDCFDGLTTGYNIPWTGENFGSACLDSLFAGTKYRNLTSRHKWMMVYYLYKFYISKGKETGIVLSPCALEIINRYRIRDIGRVQKIYDAIDSLNNMVVTGIETSAIHAQSQYLENNTLTIDGVLASQDIQSSAASRQHTELLAFQSGAQQLKTHILAETSSAFSFVEDDAALHMLNLSPMMLAVWDGNKAFFDQSKQDYLLQLANTCSHEIGDAKYTATYIYEWLTDTKVVTSDECENMTPRTIKSQSSDITIHPNPTSSYVNVDGADEGSIFLVYDMSGRLILKTRISSENQVVDLSELEPSVYLAQVRDSEGNIVHTQRLAKL